MDKLRAVQYFVAAAEEKSLSRAARRFDVSVAAVAKLVTVLERNLGVRLFDRSAQGLALTASGASYLEACVPALAQLQVADELVRSSTARTPGTVVVGVQHVIAHEFLTPALPRFNALHPNIHLDVRDFTRPTEEQTRGADVFLVLGWPRVAEFVQRQVGVARYIVVAAPSYWQRCGMPLHPLELTQHTCLTIRGVDGTVLDLWTFARGDEQVSVKVAGWLTAGNTHRDMVADLAIAGQGVARILDWTNRTELAAGALVEALPDWASPEAPPVNLFYRPSVRRIPRVRAFIDFVVEVFRDLDATRGQRVVASPRPAWLARPYGRASASLKKER